MHALQLTTPEAATLSFSLDDTLDDAQDADTPDADTLPRETGPFEAVGATHPGRVREKNEDAYAIFRDLGLCIVADGLGGRRAGEVASHLAVRAVKEHLTSALHQARDDRTSGSWGIGEPRNPEPTAAHAKVPLADRLSAAVASANQAIHAAGEADPVLSGMATTVVGLLVEGGQVAIAHVGDSRAYRIRRGTVEQLTVDHSMRQLYMQVYKERARPDVAALNASKLTRALGVKAKVTVDVRVEDLEPGDVFLLCSDGLWSMVSDDELAFALAGAPSLESALAKLFATAYNRGGPDNITATILRPLAPPH